MSEWVFSGIISVVVALLGFGGGIAIAFITQNRTDKRHTEDIKNSNDTKNSDDIKEIKEMIQELKVSHQQFQTVVELKIDSLEKKQDKHNNLIERTYKLEQDSVLHEEQIRVANHRINDLENRTA